MLNLFSALKGRVRAKVPLAGYVAYGLGGPAEVFIEPADESDIRLAVEICKTQNLPLLTLGSGTNLLVRDGGVDGVVLYLGAGLPGDVEILSESASDVVIRVPSHWPKARLLALAVERGWGGLEFSAGIPGTMGGAIWMNAGTKWGSYGEVIESVKLFNPDRGFEIKSKAEMKFTYRGHGEGLIDAHTIIVSADLRLSKLKSKVQILALVDEILAYRGSKQPLERPNCGSVFKNPANSERGAGRLIEASGLKGHRIGGAEVSNKHANFLLNLGAGATAHDVETLILFCQKTVLQKFGIQLEREVIIVGKA